jgi:hypothetical protein
VPLKNPLLLICRARRAPSDAIQAEIQSPKSNPGCDKAAIAAMTATSRGMAAAATMKRSAAP